MLKKIFMGICCFFVAFTSSGCEKTVLTPTYEQTTGDYVLNISVSATSFKKGEDIEVTMVFENNGGQEQEYYFGQTFMDAYVVGFFNYNEGQHTEDFFRSLPQGTTINNKTLNIQLNEGNYELISIAGFLLINEWIQVTSNTIFITVE